MENFQESIYYKMTLEIYVNKVYNFKSKECLCFNKERGLYKANNSNYMYMDLQLFSQQDDQGEKTEKPTPKKRREAREKGQVAKSKEVSSAFLLAATFGVLYIAAPYTFNRFGAFVTRLWTQYPLEYDEAGIQMLTVDVMVEFFIFLLPVLFAAVMMGIFSNIAQIGFLITGEPLKPKPERMNPVKGFQRIFSKRALVELVKSLLKVGMIGYISYFVFVTNMDNFPRFVDMGVGQAAMNTGEIVFTLVLLVALALLIISILDYVYQWWEHEQNLMMTKYEVKQEHKQTEGDPQIRSKIKEKQREAARRRMMQDVPEADVVITNPIHLAVALKYEEEYGVPYVVAKGQGKVAERIKEVAEENEVVIMENEWLARNLYYTVDIGEEIPEELYQAVAEVLAFVYRLQGAV